MRFGMGIILTKEEEERAAPITKSCFAALGLANDFYSFDIEWEAFQSGQEKSMTSLEWSVIGNRYSVEDNSQMPSRPIPEHCRKETRLDPVSQLSYIG